MNKFNFLINLAVREWDPFVFVLVLLAAIAAKIFPETVIDNCMFDIMDTWDFSKN